MMKLCKLGSYFPFNCIHKSVHNPVVQNNHLFDNSKHWTIVRAPRADDTRSNLTYKLIWMRIIGEYLHIKQRIKEVSRPSSWAADDGASNYNDIDKLKATHNEFLAHLSSNETPSALTCPEVRHYWTCLIHCRSRVVPHRRIQWGDVPSNNAIKSLLNLNIDDLISTALPENNL